MTLKTGTKRIIKGHMLYSVNGERAELNEGDVIFVNSARLHYGYWEKKEECEFLCVLFGLAMLSLAPESILSKLVNSDAPPFIVFHDSEPDGRAVTDKLKALNKMCAQREEGYELSVVSLCYEITSLLFGHCTGGHRYSTENSRKLSELHAMIGFIQGHYTEKLSLADISASGQVCRSKCFDLFKKFVGKTPFDYLNEYRISKSLDMLKNTDMNVTEIAMRCGFGNSSYFAEVFRRYIGKSPKQFQYDFKNQ